MTGARVQIPPSPPRRNNVRFVPTFFFWESATRSLASPFPKKAALLRLCPAANFVRLLSTRKRKGCGPLYLACAPLSIVGMFRSHRIERAIGRKAHHHGIHHAQCGSIPRKRAGEERGYQQDDQRYHIAEDPRRDAVNETNPFQKLRHECRCQCRAGVSCKNRPGEKIVHTVHFLSHFAAYYLICFKHMQTFRCKTVCANCFMRVLPVFTVQQSMEHAKPRVNLPRGFSACIDNMICAPL